MWPISALVVELVGVAGFEPATPSGAVLDPQIICRDLGNWPTGDAVPTLQVIPQHPRVRGSGADWQGRRNRFASVSLGRLAP
jgi:hypothetical protein